jgi:hypothetical protein
MAGPGRTLPGVDPWCRQRRPIPFIRAAPKGDVMIQAWPSSFARLLERPAHRKAERVPLGVELERTYRQVLREMLPLMRETPARRTRKRAA